MEDRTLGCLGFKDYGVEVVVVGIGFRALWFKDLLGFRVSCSEDKGLGVRV